MGFSRCNRSCISTDCKGTVSKALGREGAAVANLNVTLRRPFGLGSDRQVREKSLVFSTARPLVNERSLLLKAKISMEMRKNGIGMKNKFILLEADENEDSERSDSESEDDDEANSRATTKIPSEYNLPSANSSSRLERLIQHLEEEAIHLQHISKSGSSHVPTADGPSSFKIPRRATSMPPLDISQMTPPPQRRHPLSAASSVSASTTSDSDFESSSKARTRTSPETRRSSMNGAFVPEGEQDSEMEVFEADLTNEQRLLKYWIKKYLGVGELIAPEFKLFYVRCERQFEHRIVERIRTDVQHRNVDPSILRAAFPSASPGGVYLQAKSMLPQNTVLASYLLTIPGLLYPRKPRVIFPAHESEIPTTSARTDLVLPIHSTIENPSGIERILREPSQLDQYPPRTWIRCKHGLYKDDVGLVVVDDYDQIDYDVERLVLFPPRVDLARASDFSSSQGSLKRKRKGEKRPEILSWESGKDVTRDYCVPARLACHAVHCKNPSSCSHSEAAQKRYFFLGHYWQNGLVFERVKLGHMEFASDISADSRYYFLTSKHPAVQQSLVWMPPPSSWEFEAGEAVRFTNFDGTWCTPDRDYAFELPEGRTEGIVHYVGPSYCEVNIPLQDSGFTVNALHTMSKAHLEKIFCPGDTVMLLPGAERRLALSSGSNLELDASEAPEKNNSLERKEGLVLTAGPAKVEVSLWKERCNIELEEQIFDFHPNTLRKIECSVSDNEVLRYRPEDYLGAIDPSTDQDIRHCSPKTFTGQNPWMHLHVYPIKRSTKGYRAQVVDARFDQDTKSGLSIQIRYETQGMSNPLAWVDYDSLRRVDNSRFLHDYDGLDVAGLHAKEYGGFGGFKPGYCPVYSIDEQQLLECQKSHQEVEASADITGVSMPSEDMVAELAPRETTPFSFPPDTETNTNLDPAWDPSSPNPSSPTDSSSPIPSSSSPSSTNSSSLDPSAQPWILDPRIVKALQDGLELLVATSTIPNTDRRVSVCIVDDIPRVYTRAEGSRKKTRNGEIIDPRTILENPRSFSLPSNPSVAKGLYIICSGDRTGVLCRRLSYMMRLDPSKPPRWLVQAVKLIRTLRTYIQFDEIIDMEIGTVWVEDGTSSSFVC
ncbi:hypothetical protein EV361DRAFT_1032381 [Lentinula raphanica]|nr:hypothetical protein EV361DRAFT_1032381 [Lentinula raphanica]